jgi:hypothetical protein
MKNSRFSRQLKIILGSGCLILGFQNCAKSKLSSGADAGLSQGVSEVTGVTSQYSKVTYDINMELGAGIASASSSEAVDVDLDQGLVIFRSRAGQKSCALDVSREQKLRGLLSVGRVCKVRPPEGAAVCMAISLADIRLANSNDSILLRPIGSCFNGIFLCDGDDQILREILADIIKNKPSACQ